MASESLPVRRRPTRVKLGDSHRTSNLIRASVLETALELGFGQNSTVADWIFNNPVSEEPEDLQSESITGASFVAPSESAPDVTENVTPTFTSGSNSLSDESSSLHSAANNAPSAAIATIQIHTHKPSLTESPHVHFSDFSSDQLQLFSPFTLSPHGPHVEHKDSTIGRPRKDTERPRSQEDTFRGDPIRESPELVGGDSGYTSEGQYLSKVKTSKGKDKSKGKKGWRPKTPERSSEKDVDYTSDGGYLSASSNKSQGKSPGKVKSRAMAFFRRRPKKSTSDDDDDASIPPVPALPTLPRPSSPKPLERRAVPSSPSRPGFSPLSLNLVNPPISPPRRRLSNSPPPSHARPAPTQRSDHLSVPERPASPPVKSASAPVLTPPATVPLPPSVPGTPLSTTSFPAISVSSTRHAPGTGSISKLSASSSRQHFTIPPPAPPPTLPLPQPPPSPSASINGQFLAMPVPQSRRGSPARPIPVAPAAPGLTQPLSSRRTASPFRPVLSPRSLSGSDSSQLNGKEAIAMRSGIALSAGVGSAPAFLQRKIQHVPPPSPRRPPPDVPLPLSPFLAPGTRPRTPISSSSKFHEHLSSISSVPLSEVLSPPSKSPSPSTATLSGSSSGPSVRSSNISSISERNDESVIRDSLNKSLRPTTSSSSMSEFSCSQPISSTLGRSALDLQSQISDKSDSSSSVYSPPMHRDSNSVTTYDDDDADIENAVPKSFIDVEDDDASMYPSDDKTAGRRTMYLLEHGEPNESEDEVVINGSRYWVNSEAPPPVPPLPPVSTRPGPGYF